MRRPVFAALFLVTAPTLAATYTLEPDYTQTVFRWDHLGFTSPAAQISQGEGMVEFDAADPSKSSVTVTFKLATLQTGVSGLDEHLASDDFFDAQHNPTATFKSTSIQRGAGAGQFKVVGNLSMHGITKPVTLDAKLNKTANNPRTNIPTLGFVATATIKRSEFGLGAFVPQVGDDVQLQITAQAAEATAYAKYLKAQAEKSGKE